MPGDPDETSGVGTTRHGLRARARGLLMLHGLAYEVALTALAGVWVVLGLLMRGADDAADRTILSLSGAIGVVYLADVALRARASGVPRAYLRHHAPVALLALVGVLPIEPLVQLARFALAFVGLRRVLARLGGVFGRYSRLDELISLSLTSWAAGGVLIYELEVGTNDRVATIWDGLWWSLVTITTVGYGDIAPITPAGRLVGAVLITVGVGLFAAAVALIGRYLGEGRRGDPGPRERLARVAELERLHADGAIDVATFGRRVRELAGGREGR